MVSSLFNRPPIGAFREESLPPLPWRNHSLKQPTACREKVGLLFMPDNFIQSTFHALPFPAPTAKQQPSSIKKYKDIFVNPILPQPRNVSFKTRTKISEVHNSEEKKGTHAQSLPRFIFRLLGFWNGAWPTAGLIMPSLFIWVILLWTVQLTTRWIKDCQTST